MSRIQYIVALVLVAGIVPGCKQKVEQSPVQQPKVDTEFTFPYFKVDVQLTQEAEKRVMDLKYPISVDFLFANEIGTDLSKEDYSEIVKISKPQIIATDILKIDKEKFKGLKPGYEVLVNVYSRGKEDGSNILSCGIIQDKIEILLGGLYIIKCDLIK